MLLKSLALLTVLTVTSLPITFARLSWGACPQVKTVEDFDLSQYTGVWYEIKRDKITEFEDGGKCTTATYSANKDGSIKVVNKQIVGGKKDSIEGRA